MNTEEERKSFESVVCPGGIASNVIWNGEKYTFKDGSRCMTQDYFEVWLSAKGHSDEMKKPTVRVQPVVTSYPFVVALYDESDSFDGILGSFLTEDEANTWATEKGYRVIE